MAREDTESGHRRPAHLHAAFADLRRTVDELARPFDDAAPCRLCLRALLTTIAIERGIAYLRELLADEDEAAA